MNFNNEILKYRDEEREMWSKHVSRLFGEVIVFSLLGLLFGFLLTYLFPALMPDESPWLSLLYVILQVLINTIIIFAIDEAYVCIFKHDSDDYVGITVFSIVLFACQFQIQGRIRYIYRKTTNDVRNA